MLGRKKQFGIGALLLLTACIAGYLTAYKFGLDELQAMRDRAVTVRTYDVSDLVTPTSSLATVETDLSSLKSLIESTTNGDWDRGQFTVQTFPGNESLVIEQTGEVHGKISELLDDVRALTRHQNKSLSLNR